MPAALVCLVGALLAGILVGAVDLGVGPVLRSIADRLPFVSVESGLTRQQEAVLWQLRLPRVVLGALVGAMLSIAGAAYQGAFRNPLADPYLLGAAAGAGLGATLAITYGPRASSLPIDVIPLAAFVGSLTGVACAYGIGMTVDRGRSTTGLILAGVAVASFLTAIQTFVQQRESDTLREVYGWILGGLSLGSWDDVLLILPYVIISSVVILLHGRLLDVLSLGDEEADSLGVDTRRVRLLVVVMASLGTAAAVAVSGLVGFVGIVVPHVVRLLVGASYRAIAPLSLIVGAAFVVLADLFARTVMSPIELPLGVVTAFLGAPFFALVLRTGRGGGAS